jgi:hypothetical protein
MDPLFVLAQVHITSMGAPRVRVPRTRWTWPTLRLGRPAPALRPVHSARMGECPA